MYERILLGLDAGKVAASAVRAVPILAASNSQVLVVHVRGIEHGLRTRSEAERLVDRTVARLREAGVRAQGEVRTISDEHVATALLDSAWRSGADLIVLGSHGRSELGGLLLGSVGQEVAAGTTVAVVLIHGEAGRPSRRWPARIGAVLLAVDRSERSEATICATLELCRQHGATVTVLYVEPVLESPGSAHRYVHGIVDRFRQAGVAARASSPGGAASVPVQIVEAAERTGADLIVIGSRRRGELAAIVMGSVARELVRLTAIPVLLAETPLRRPKRPATDQAHARTTQEDALR